MQRSLALRKNPFITDHTVGGDAVFPIVCSIAWMADSCEKAYPDHHVCSCEDVRVLNGIVFNDTLADSYKIDIKELGKRSTGEIDVEVRVSSMNEANKLRFHYSGKFQLTTGTPAVERIENFDQTETNVVEGSRFYKDGTLFHGPAFDGIRQQLNLNDQGATFACVAPVVSEESRGEFSIGCFNPYAEDLLLQAIVVWARDRYQAASLPLKIERDEFRRVIPMGQEFFITIVVVNHSATKLVANAIAHDRDGKIFSKMSGAEVTISKNLNDKFRPHQG